MSDFKATPITDLTVDQLLDRYQIHDESLLQNWAKLHGMNGYRRIYSPSEIGLLDHVHHHLQILSMDVEDYQELIRCRPQSQQIQFQSTPCKDTNLIQHNGPHNMLNNTQSNHSEPSIPDCATDEPEPQSNEFVQQAGEMVSVLLEQYSATVDLMGDHIAEQFIEELDASVMRHLAQKVKERQSSSDRTRQNRFLQVIQTVLKSKGDLLLAPSPREVSSLEMENTHRLG
ncbi:MAG: hypothetical protein ACRC8A_06745 [Microcoleaceae cyanobacterium]